MSSASEHSVVALVTAYNEQETIGAVIDALRAAPSVARVHVVDDASTDETRAVALARGAEVTTLLTKLPVGEAIMAHLEAVTEETLLLWCDADLVGLAPEHVEALIARYQRGDIVQSLSSRGAPRSWPRAFRGRAVQAAWAWLFGPISGERVIRRSDFVAAIDLSRSLGWSEMMRGYGIVLFLNWWAGAFGSGSAVTYFDELRQRQKFQKRGLGGFVSMARQWAQFGLVWVKIRLNARRLRAAVQTETARA